MPFINDQSFEVDCAMANGVCEVTCDLTERCLDCIFRVVGINVSCRQRAYNSLIGIASNHLNLK